MGVKHGASAIKAVLFAVSCFASCEMIGQSEIYLLLEFSCNAYERLFALPQIA